MQAIIMAAGKGSRLYPLTKEQPKCLLELGGKTILSHHLDVLANNGITDTVVVTGYKAHKVEEHLEGRKGVRIVFNPFYEHCNVLGSFWMGMPFLNNEFIFIHGDT